MITKHIWDTSRSIFWMESTCSAKSAMWSHCWVYSKCDQSVIGLHIVVTLGWLFKMGVICNQWAHFCYSGSKHSECAQFLTIGQIVDPLQRTFKIYPIFNHWVHCGQVLSVPTMYSPCAHWVYGSLFPVSGSPELWLVGVREDGQRGSRAGLGGWREDGLFWGFSSQVIVWRSDSWCQE